MRQEERDPLREAMPMSDERAMRIENLKHSIERADYVVDPRAVAEAMLRRVVAARAARLAALGPRPS